MQKIKLLLLLSGGGILTIISLPCRTQSMPRFDSAWIQPPAPVTGQEVWLVYSASFPSASCHLVQNGIQQQFNNLQVFLYHFEGMLTVLCHTIDSLSLGTFPPGTYSLTAYLLYHGSPDIKDSVTLSFTVLPQMGMNNSISYGEDGCVFFPLPVRAGETLAWRCKEDCDVDYWEIRDYSGRVLNRAAAISSAGTMLFPLPSSWSSGVYYLQGWTKYGLPIVRKRLIIIQ